MSIIKGFMVPHPPLIVSEVGKGSEKQVNKTIESYIEVAQEIGKLKPDTIIISSPHADMYSNYFHILNAERLVGSFEDFGAPNVSFDCENDLELVNEIANNCMNKNFPGGTLKDKEGYLDHGCMVSLYFIRKYLKDFKVLVVSLSGLDYIKHYEFGKIIKDSVDKLGRKAVFIASGDLSHKLQEYGPYGFIKEGPMYDKNIMEIMSKGDFLKLLTLDKNIINKASECGHRSFIIMSGVFDGLNVKSKMLSHEDVTGVGYGICTYFPQEKNSDRKILDKYYKLIEETLNKKYTECDEYVLLARKTIFEYINNNKIIDIPKDISKTLLNEKHGVFVSLHKFDELRGCIGTIDATTSCVAEEIIRNAISACINDYRFEKVTKDELKFLDISVDVLTHPEDISSSKELDVKKYGVIVTCNGKRGLLLPDLEGIDTVEEQIRIASLKAGIEKNEKIKLQRFEVIRHK